MLIISFFSSILFPYVYKETEQIFLPVIMYHSVYPSRNNNYVVSPLILENDMEFLKINGYNPVFASEVVNFLNGDETLPQNPILITLDDGYYNNFTKVKPIMEKYNFKYNIGIVGAFSDRVEKQHEFFSYLTWEQIASMSKSKLVEFQNHSYNMHYLNARKGVRQCYLETDEEYENKLSKDANSCAEKLLAYTGKRPSCFVYPFGIYSEKSNKILSKNGYSLFLTCNEKPNYIKKGNGSAELGRYNRASWYSTSSFFERVLKK